MSTFLFFFSISCFEFDFSCWLFFFRLCLNQGFWPYRMTDFYNCTVGKHISHWFEQWHATNLTSIIHSASSTVQRAQNHLVNLASWKHRGGGPISVPGGSHGQRTGMVRKELGGGCKGSMIYRKTQWGTQNNGQMAENSTSIPLLYHWSRTTQPVECPWDEHPFQFLLSGHCIGCLRT